MIRHSTTTFLFMTAFLVLAAPVGAQQDTVSRRQLPVGSPFAGGVPQGPPTSETLQLTVVQIAAVQSESATQQPGMGGLSQLWVARSQLSCVQIRPSEHCVLPLQQPVGQLMASQRHWPERQRLR